MLFNNAREQSNSKYEQISNEIKEQILKISSISNDFISCKENIENVVIKSSELESMSSDSFVLLLKKLDTAAQEDCLRLVSLRNFMKQTLGSLETLSNSHFKSNNIRESLNEEKEDFREKMPHTINSFTIPDSSLENSNPFSKVNTKKPNDKKKKMNFTTRLKSTDILDKDSNLSVQLVTPSNDPTQEKLWVIEKFDTSNVDDYCTSWVMYRLSAFSTANCNLEYRANVRFFTRNIFFGFLKNFLVFNSNVSPYPPNDISSDGYFNLKYSKEFSIKQKVGGGSACRWEVFRYFPIAKTSYWLIAWNNKFSLLEGASITPPDVIYNCNEDCGFIFDVKRLDKSPFCFIGTNTGLFMFDFPKHSLHKISEKPVYSIDVVTNDNSSMIAVGSAGMVKVFDIFYDRGVKLYLKWKLVGPNKLFRKRIVLMGDYIYIQRTFKLFKFKISKSKEASLDSGIEVETGFKVKHLEIDYSRKKLLMVNELGELKTFVDSIQSEIKELYN